MEMVEVASTNLMGFIFYGSVCAGCGLGKSLRFRPLASKNIKATSNTV